MISIGGQKQPQVNLKKLAWKKLMLNQQTIARTGGAIWKELPQVEVPKETFTHLFTQHTVVKEKTIETVSTYTCTHHTPEVCYKHAALSQQDNYYVYTSSNSFSSIFHHFSGCTRKEGENTYRAKSAKSQKHSDHDQQVSSG